MIKKVSDLEVYNLAYRIAMDIFKISRFFPREERYSLTSQVVRSSRSIAANIAEGWGKRNFENDFKRHLIYALGSLEETKTWMQFAKDCGYVSDEELADMLVRLDSLGGKIFKLSENWRTL